MVLELEQHSCLDFYVAGGRLGFKVHTDPCTSKIWIYRSSEGFVLYEIYLNKSCKIIQQILN